MKKTIFFFFFILLLTGCIEKETIYDKPENFIIVKDLNHNEISLLDLEIKCKTYCKPYDYELIPNNKENIMHCNCY